MAWKEDVGSGDITSAACVPADAVEAAGFLVKGDGVLAGLAVAEAVFAYGAPDSAHRVSPGVLSPVEGPAAQVLTAERLALNFMQRRQRLHGDPAGGGCHGRNGHAGPRHPKGDPGTAPVREAGGGHQGRVNHRMGLYDQILIKDNHIDYAGSVQAAVRAHTVTSHRWGSSPGGRGGPRPGGGNAALAVGCGPLAPRQFLSEEARAAVAHIAGAVPTKPAGG